MEAGVLFLEPLIFVTTQCSWKVLHTQFYLKQLNCSIKLLQIRICLKYFLMYLVSDTVTPWLNFLFTEFLIFTCSSSIFISWQCYRFFFFTLFQDLVEASEVVSLVVDFPEDVSDLFYNSLCKYLKNCNDKYIRSF